MGKVASQAGAKQGPLHLGPRARVRAAAAATASWPAEVKAEQGVDTTTGWAHSLRHMLESLKPHGGKRWPRGQKFVLSSSGTQAELAYREAVQAARAQGRAALLAAERAWAAPLRVEAFDGVVLSELRAGRKSIAEVARGLEDCGTSPAEVRAAMDRLSDVGLVEPAPATIAAA